MKHYNPALAEELMKHFVLKTGDMSSPEVVPYIQPTFDVRPHLRSVTALLGNGLSQAIMTTNASRDTYIVACNLNYQDTAGNLANNCKITYVWQGVTRELMQLGMLSGVAGSNQGTMSFPFPGIPCDRNTAITITASDGTATIIVGASLVFYETDSSRV